MSWEGACQCRGCTQANQAHCFRCFEGFWGTTDCAWIGSTFALTRSDSPRKHFTLAKFEDSGSLTQQCQLAEIDEGERTLRLGRDSVGL